jgi:hypothetical protein
LHWLLVLAFSRRKLLLPVAGLLRDKSSVLTGG